MIRQYKIYQEHPNFINAHLFEDGKEAGGYIVSNNLKRYIKGFLKRQGYKEVEELKIGENELKMGMTKKEALKNAIRTIILDICYDVYNNGIRKINDKYAREKTNEIIKEISIRFPIGD